MGGLLNSQRSIEKLALVLLELLFHYLEGQSKEQTKYQRFLLLLFNIFRIVSTVHRVYLNCDRSGLGDNDKICQETKQFLVGCTKMFIKGFKPNLRIHLICLIILGYIM